MDQESITKGLLSGLIDRYLVEVAEDPNRSIRKLVDIAERTSDGPTQKICYQMMQQMAANADSPYYEMIHHLVTHTAPQTVKQFGINLGHNAWTFGAGNIRRIIASSAASLSWAVVIDRSEVPGRIPFSEIADLVCRGRKNEIYAWLLISAGLLSEWDKYTELFRAHPDCVFGLCLDPEALSEAVLEEAAEIPNLMVILNTEAQDWQPAAEKLSQAGCLFSAFRRIRNAEQAAEITDGSWLEELSPRHPLMAFSFTEDTCPEETSREVSCYMWETRLRQLYPVLPVDLISDFLIISRLVSHTDVFYRVEPDGSVSAGKSLRFEPCGLTVSELFCGPLSI